MADIERHRSRLSGPLVDRLDMQVRLSPVALRSLGAHTTGESSAEVRARVELARSRQRQRYRGVATVSCNAQVVGRWLDTRTQIASDARELLASAAERCGLSARGYHRVLKVARTIADLDERDAIEWTHVAEALRYRPVVRGAGQAVEVPEAPDDAPTASGGPPTIAIVR